MKYTTFVYGAAAAMIAASPAAAITTAKITGSYSGGSFITGSDRYTQESFDLPDAGFFEINLRELDAGIFGRGSVRVNGYLLPQPILITWIYLTGPRALFMLQHEYRDSLNLDLSFDRPLDLQETYKRDFSQAVPYLRPTGLSRGIWKLENVRSTNGINTSFSDVVLSTAPEPITWGLMVLGFGVIGTQLRRRRGSRASLAA